MVKVGPKDKKNASRTQTGGRNVLFQEIKSDTFGQDCNILIVL